MKSNAKRTIVEVLVLTVGLIIAAIWYIVAKGDPSYGNIISQFPLI